MIQSHFALPRFLTTSEVILSRMVPPPSIDGVITIRCDDVFDTIKPFLNATSFLSHDTDFTEYDQAMGIDRFMKIIRNHPAEFLHYSTFGKVSQLFIAEAMVSPFILPPFIENEPIALVSSRIIGNRGYFTRVLVLMKSIIQSLKIHYNDMETEGIGIWNEFGRQMNSPHLIPFINFNNYHDFVAWRCLPLFQSALMVTRYHLLCSDAPGMHMHLYLGQLSILGIINRLMEELHFPHLNITKGVISSILQESFHLNNESTKRSNSPYYLLVKTVQEMTQRNAFLTMKMIHYFLPVSPHSKFHKLPSELFAHVGSFLIGDCDYVTQLASLI